MEIFLFIAWLIGVMIVYAGWTIINIKLDKIMTAQDDLKAALDQDEVLLDAVLAFIIKLQGQAGETITPELIAEAKDIGAKLQTVNTGSTPPTV